MLIKCWGSRGSIPVSGREYIKYGGDSTCMEIRPKDGRVIIIDAGTGIRGLGKTLQKEKCRKVEMYFTHAHWDHIIGFPYFRPIYMHDFEIVIHCCPYGIDIEKVLEYQMMPPLFPVNFKQIKAQIEYVEDVEVPAGAGGFSVEPVRISHPNQGAGYKFTEDGKSFVFITDNELGHVHRGGLSFEAYRDFCSGADLLVHDAEFTPREYEKFHSWGHSSYTSALELALSAGVKRFGLFHFNQERTDRQVDNIVRSCREIINDRGSAMECFGVNCGWSMEL